MKSAKKFLLLLLCVAMLVAGALIMSACSKDCTEHAWVDWTESTAATCIAEGAETRTCSECGETETRKIDKIAHTFSTYMSDGNATCLADGTKTATCTTDGCTAKDTVTDEGSKKAHSFTAYVSNGDATCQADGTKTATCTTDGCTATETVTDEGSKKSHSFTTYHSNNNATCSADGTKTAVCDWYGCNETDTIEDEGSKKSHSFTTYVSNGNATCVLDGTKTAICDFSGCNETDTIEDEGSKLGHLWNTALACETGHYCTRDNCDAEEAALGHDYRVIGGTELTCEQNSTTVYACQNGCSDTFTVTNQVAIGHSVDEWELDGEEFIGECTYVLTYVGTCVNDGCGQTLSKTEEVVRHTLKSTIHSDATCSNPGQKHITCSECNGYEAYENYTNSEAHVWGVKSVDGNITTYECSECGSTKTAITATGQTEATVDKSTLESAGEIELKDASIALDSETLGSLDGEVSISAGTLEGSELDTVKDTLDQNKLDQIGENPIYNFGLTDASGTVSNFNGWVTIRVPYTLADGEDVDSIAVWFINDQGEVESIAATYDNGYAVFSTNHFSYYTVTRLTPTQRCELYDHTYKEITVQSTCVSDGYVLKVCQRCGKSVKEITDRATGHIITTVNVAPSCTESGTATHSCDACDYERIEKIAATGHAWTEDDKLEATCKNAGYTVHKCSECDATYKTVIAQKAHSYTDTVTKATCTTDGYTTRVCQWCEYTVTTNKIAALGHDYKTSVVANGCTTEGYTLHDCSRCDASYKTDIVPPAHTWDIETPTCGKGQTCILCGIGGQSATGEHTMVNGVCSVCGVGCKHTFNSVVTAPTCNEVGYTTNTCTVCGVVEKTDYKSATGHTGALSCTVCGESIVPEDYYTNVIESLLNEKYTILIESIKINEGMYIVDSEIYLSIKDGINGWGTVNVKAYGQIAIFSAIIEDGIIYVCGENTTALTESKDIYAKIPITDLISDSEMPSSMAALVSLAMNEDVLSWTSEYLLPFLSNLTKDGRDEANLIAEVIVKLIADVEEVDGNIVITPSAEKLKALNARLATETIGEFIDTEFGTGTYDDFVEAVEALLDTTVGELIDGAAANGADVIELIDSLDALATKIVGDECTISDLIGLDGTVQEMLESEELRAITVVQILEMMMAEEQPTDSPNHSENIKVNGTANGSTEAEEEIDVAAEIINYLTLLKDMTVYELAGVETNLDVAVEYIDGIIDESLAEVSVCVATDKNGKLISLDFAYAEYCNLSIVADYVSDIDYSDIKAKAEANTNLNADADYLIGTYEDGEYIFEIDENGKLVGVWYTDFYEYRKTLENGSDDNGNYYEIVIVETELCEYSADLTKALILTHSDCKRWFGVAMMAPGTYSYTNKVVIERYENGKLVETIDDPTILEMLGYGSKAESYVEDAFIEVTFFINSETGEIAEFDNAYTLHEYEEDEAKHVPAVGCEGVGEYHYFCTECGETLVVPYTNGHDYEWIYELAPGATDCEDGVIAKHVCTACGKVSGTYETNYHETHWEELDLSGYGVCEHHYFEKYSCLCGKNCSFSYGNGLEWIEDGVYFCSECGVTVTESSTYTPGEGCEVNEVRVIVITKNGATLYSETVNRTYEEHNTRIEATLLPGATDCEDGVKIIYRCTKCGEVTEEWETYHHYEYEMVLVDFSNYGSTCGGYIYTYSCACGNNENKDWINVSNDCELEETCIYYNEWRDCCYKYTCAVTSPACGFTYYVRTRFVENSCGYTVYVEYYVTENNSEIILYSYIQEENTSHNHEPISESKTPANLPCLYLVSRVERCTVCGDENTYSGYEFEHDMTKENGNCCSNCDEGYRETYDENGLIGYIYVHWSAYGNSVSRLFEEYRFMYFMDHQFTAYTHNACDYYLLENGEWILNNSEWYTNTYDYDFSNECTVTRTYASYYEEGYSETCCACEYFTYGAATEATCTQYGTGAKTCDICGTQSTYEINPICHEWVWYDGGSCYACVHCGLKNENGASGEIVLEDASDLDGDEDTYIVGYFYRMNDKFEVIYAITLITADGEEIYLDLDAYGIDITPWGDGNYITFSKSAVMNAASQLGFTESQYDIRISFVPVGWDKVLDYAITFEVMSATDECVHCYGYGNTCIFCGYVAKGENAEDGNCKHEYTETSSSDATCTEAGYYRETCVDCGETISERYTEAFGHSFADGRCTVCGEGEVTEEKEVLYFYNSKELTLTLYSDNTSYFTELIYTAEGTVNSFEGEDSWYMADGKIYAKVNDNEYVYTATDSGELVPYEE